MLTFVTSAKCAVINRAHARASATVVPVFCSTKKAQPGEVLAGAWGIYHMGPAERYVNLFPLQERSGQARGGVGAVCMLAPVRYTPPWCPAINHLRLRASELSLSLTLTLSEPNTPTFSRPQRNKSTTIYNGRRRIDNTGSSYSRCSSEPVKSHCV